MDGNNSKMLSAVMWRYGGLCGLYDAMDEDYDTVLVNLEHDSGVDMYEIEDWINRISNTTTYGEVECK